MRTVEILYFNGCPNVDLTADRVRVVAARLGVRIDLRLVLVASVEDAVHEKFLGSPTVRVDGTDVDSSSWDRSDFGLSCRVYRGSGIPAEAMLAAALTPTAADAHPFLGGDAP